VNTERKKLIVVVAMHRSGSSAITNALPILGVHLGDSLLDGIEGNNAKGFFEDEELNALNIEMLAAVGNDWHHLAPLTHLDFDLLRQNGFFLRAVELLRAKTTNIQIFGFKDPRVSKLLPFWQKVFAHCAFEVSYLLTLRNPISVARSLSQRNSFIPGKSYLLWLQHVLAGITQTAGASRVIVDYDDFLQNPDRCLDLCAERFGLTVDSRQLDAYKLEFLDLTLRHSQFAPEDFPQEFMCPPLAREVYAALRECALGVRDLDSEDAQKRAVAWSSELDRLKPVFFLTDRLSAQVDEYYRSAVDSGRELINQRETLRLLEQRFVEAEQKSQAEAAELRERVGELTRQNTSLEGACRQASIFEATRDRDAVKEQIQREHEFNARLLTEGDESRRIAQEFRQTLIADRQAAAQERENLIQALIEAQRSLAEAANAQNQTNATAKSCEMEQHQAHVARENALRAENQSLHLELARVAEQHRENDKALTERLYALQAEIDRLNAEDTAQADVLNTQLQDLQANLQQARDSLEQHATAHRGDVSDLKCLFVTASDQLQALEREIQVSRQRNETLQNDLLHLKATMSWKCTAPMRGLGRWLRVGRPGSKA
jgi:hypothetical protein